MSEIITDRTTIDLVYMTEKAINDGTELARLRNQKQALVRTLRRIIARSVHQPSDTHEDRIRDLRHIEALAREAAAAAEGR